MSEQPRPTPADIAPRTTGDATELVAEVLDRVGSLDELDAATRLERLSTAQEELVAILESSRAGAPQRPIPGMDHA